MASMHPDREDWGVCSFEDCEKFVAIKKHGLCNQHYRLRLVLRGKAEGLNLDEAAQEFWSRVNILEPEACWPWRLRPHKHGHGTFLYHNVSYHAHTISYRLVNGPIPEGKIVDHKCRNRICVNPNHLQAATSKENAENVGVRKDSKSGYRGVTLRPESGRWRARVGHNDRVIHVGHFATEEEAHEAAVAARLKLHTNNLIDREGME